MNRSEPEETPLERRTQVRIRVQIPARLRVPDRDEPLSVSCEDLSWGGLLLDIAQCLPPSRGPLRIELDWADDDQVTAEVLILRSRPLLDGHYLLGARFVSLSHGSQTRLERWLVDLRALAAPDDRAGPDVLVRELEVMANDREELRQMLEQVAKGRLKVTLVDAYEVGQSISCAVMGTEQLAGIRLRASVLDVQTLAMPGCDWAQLYEVTLGFEHPTDSIKRRVQALLDETGPEGADPVSRAEVSRRPAGRGPIPPSRLSRRPESVRQTMDFRSALETAFPEVLNHVIPGWGSVQVFERLFRELVLGDAFQLGGWPDEVWAELTLLQDVHDLAYGVPATRTATLEGSEST